jgi:hypothetical protein
MGAGAPGGSAPPSPMADGVGCSSRFPSTRTLNGGRKPRHPVAGTVNGMRVRGVVELHDGVHGFLVRPAWLRGCHLAAGDHVQVHIEPEGPQRADLADERGRASERQSDFGPVLDGLAQFYRRGYLRWIDATKRSPELRQQRIATMVELLEAGVKDYHENRTAGARVFKRCGSVRRSPF